MDPKTYAIQLEKKLIEQFKDSFYEKMGYYPTVITRVQTDMDQYLPMMSLQSLEDFFQPYLTILTYIKEHYESPTMDNANQVQCEPEPALLP